MSRSLAFRPHGCSRSARLRFGLSAITMGLLAGALGCQQEIQAGPTKADFAAERSRLAREASQARVEPPSAETAATSSASSPAKSDVSYRAEGRRDPFRSMLYEIEEAKEERTRAPLEQFELGQIVLMGVVWEAEEPRALVTDPEGRSFVIRSGSRIGKNEGRVTHIGDNLVRVKETYVNFAGEEARKDVELRIRRSQGG